MKRDYDLIMEVSRRKNLHFRLALIHAEVGRERVRRSLREGKVVPLGPAPPLQEEDLDNTVRIVGQMGVEPLTGALEAGADVVVAGRAYDPSVFAAPHMGKILECGAIAAIPGSGSDCLMGCLGEEYFEVWPLNPVRCCTVTSVAAHTLYEKTNPLLLPGPGGYLDLKEAKFTQVSENRVRVTGSKFIPSDRYTVKLEGVKKAGYRTVSIAGCRDPVMVREIDRVTGLVKERTRDNFAAAGYEYTLDFKLYGINGVMGKLEPEQAPHPRELGVVIEAVAQTQEVADTICSFARSTMLHCSYPGRIATAGNLAFPFSPSDFRGGEVYRFSVYHLMEVDDPFELFPMEMIDV